VPALLWAATVLFIGGLSHVPTVQTSLPLDKVAHFFMYGLLGALVTYGWLKAQRPKRLLWVLLLAMSVGVADEIHQRWVPHRSSDVKDWIADAVGVTVAATLVLRFKKERPKHVV
jgi:VanZ family protein